jgi:hypothetical protein
MAGLAATMPISGPWALQFMWRHRWLDCADHREPAGQRGRARHRARGAHLRIQ